MSFGVETYVLKMTLIVICGIEKRARVFRCVCVCVSVKTVWDYFHRICAITCMLVKLVLLSVGTSYKGNDEGFLF